MFYFSSSCQNKGDLALFWEVSETNGSQRTNKYLRIIFDTCSTIEIHISISKHKDREEIKDLIYDSEETKTIILETLLKLYPKSKGVK